MLYMNIYQIYLLYLIVHVLHMGNSEMDTIIAISFIIYNIIAYQNIVKIRQFFCIILN